jgi:hypothetical protein
MEARCFLTDLTDLIILGKILVAAQPHTTIGVNNKDIYCAARPRGESQLDERDR